MVRKDSIQINGVQESFSSEGSSEKHSETSSNYNSRNNAVKSDENFGFAIKKFTKKIGVKLGHREDVG